VPEISVADSSALEDPAGGLQRHPASISFPVTLSAFTSQVVTVDYSTAGGTATSGVDFVPTSGTLSFPPNVTSQPVSVSILDDLLDEPDETLFLNLGNPTGGVLADAQAVGTILDQDPPPDLSVADPSVLEGNQGQHSLGFVPTLSLPSGKTITLDYATAGGTATAGGDYLAAAGSLSFAPGTTALPVDVAVLGDLVHEGDETLGLALSNAVDVTLPAGPVTGTILDDDPVAAATGRELVHGSNVDASLAADPGPTGHHELYRIVVPPHASVEVVADGLSGDVAPLILDRVDADGTTVVQSAAGGSLRWENTGDTPAASFGVRVASGGCSADCDAADRYRLRSRETTASVARLNNSATQVTLLALQNTGDEALTGHAWFWGASGAPLGSQAFSLGPRAALVLDTRSVPGVDGQSGSITLSHTGRYGVLAGKAVAVEPATGFSFDTPLEARAR
jgi:Calx-beta domain